MDKLQIGISCKKANNVDFGSIDADIVITPITIDQETRETTLNYLEVLRFKEGGIRYLQIYISALEAVANAVIERRKVNASLKGKATMKHGLQEMRRTEEAMQAAVDRLLE